MSGGRRSPLHVLVAGGGVAAGELALALRALAEERVRIEIVTPSTELPFRPAATASPFTQSAVQVFDLAGIASETGAVLRRDRVEAVAPRARRVRLASGASADYDLLVVAVGARARSAVPGAITFRDQRDSHLVTDVAAGLDRARRIVLAAPAGVSWTLPLYELALLISAEVDRRGVPVEVALLSHESMPLEVFGPEVSAHVATLLADRGVRRLRGAAQSAGRGTVTLTNGETQEADRVIAVPRLVGRRLAGLPADWNGFVRTDAMGFVIDLDVDDVFAAGDVTSFPVKQGGLATQQADVIAAVIASRAGADIVPPSARHVLRARLLGAGGPCFLHAELDAAARPLPPGDVPAVSDQAGWWPAAKLFGRYLTPWMAGAAQRAEGVATP